MSRPTPPTYKTRNWPSYNEALKRRGSLTVWFDPEMTWAAAPTGKRGRQRDYGDAAIQTCLTMKGEGRPEIRPVDGFQPRTGGAPGRFGMALRQTTGFVESLLRLVGLDWAVPDFSTLSRRQKTLKVNIPYRGSGGPLHLLVDSTGIKVEGEGEWNARKHGGTKRRVWRKIHIGIDEMEEDQETVRWTVSPTTAGNPGRRVHHQRRGRCAHAARTARPDPARAGDRHRHRRWCLRHAQVPRRDRCPRCRRDHPTAQERQTLET
jgi:hypothetical protein